MPEYRWEYITVGQGHYFQAKNLKHAMAILARAPSSNLIILQRWKPKGKRKFLIRPFHMKNWSKEEIIKHYYRRGYDVNSIRRAIT